MSVKATINHLLDLVEQQEQTLIDLLSLEQRLQYGEIDRWAPKEVFAHIAVWTERTVANVKRLLGGKSWQRFENYLELNDRDFEQLRALTWDQSLAYARSARQATRDLTASLTEQDLLQSQAIDPDPPRLIWQRIIGNAVEHATIHMGLIFNEIGQSKASTKLEEQIVTSLLALSPEDPAWEGIVRYNMACRYALSGQKSEAIDWLREALTINPGLKDWSREDTDLVSLHSEQEYLALYQDNLA